MTEKLERSRRGMKGHFTRAAENLTAAITENRPMKEIDEALQLLKKRYNQVCEAHDKLCEELDDAGYDLEEGFMTVIEKILREKRGEYTNYSQKAAESDPPTQEVSKFKLQTEKSPLPKFTGDLTTYYEFKNDFQFLFRNMNDTQSKEALYVLKQCLSEKCRHWIMGETEYKEAWRTLDKFFGDPRRVSDAFIGEIMKIKSSNEGPDRMPDLYHLTKRANLTLKMVKKSSDLDNSTTIAMIERKFSHADRIKWAEMQADGIVNSTLHDLLFFMERQIWIKKNANSEIRATVKSSVNLTESLAATGSLPTPTTGHCWICAKNGTPSSHLAQNCSKFCAMTPDERLTIVRENRACYFCLRKHASECRMRKACTIVNDNGQQCQYFHHSLLHGAKFQRQQTLAVCEPVLHGFEDAILETPAEESSSPSVSATSTVSVSNTSNLAKNQVMLPVITALGSKSPIDMGEEIITLLDSGSQISLIKEQTANKLGLIGEPRTITIGTVGGGESCLQTNQYQLYVQPVTGGLKFRINALAIPRICDSISKVHNPETIARTLEIPEEAIRSRGFGDPDLLIGVDYANFHSGKVSIHDGIGLRQTPLGPVIFGGEDCCPNSSPMGMGCIGLQLNVRVTPPVDLTDFWTTESMGVAPPHCDCPYREEEILHPMTATEMEENRRIRKSAKKIDNQWLIPIPWSKDPSKLPNNYYQALSKLKGLERRLLRNDLDAQVYHKQIEDLVERGCAHIMTKEEIDAHTGPTFYISHFAVYRPDKPSTPVRVVFNSASKFQGHVLNDYQIKGPDLLNGQIAVLLRFRDFPVAVMSDISKMYHQVLIDPNLDTNLHRFLWRNYENREPDIYQMRVLTFGDKCSPALANTALDLTAESFRNQYPESAETILKSRYMDDICDSYQTSAEACTRMSEMDKIMESGHFRVKDWITNVHQGNSSSSSVSTQRNVLKNQEKVLGIVWSIEDDTLKIVVKTPKLFFKVETPLEWVMPITLTKRNALSVLAGVFDLFGFLAPFLVRAKIGMQVLWRLKLKWDEDLPHELKIFWFGWFAQLKLVDGIEVDRCVMPKEGNPTNPLLLICCDASQQAFGAVAYVRWTLENGEFTTRFMMAKSRVAPLKELSIPRLELQATVVAARLCESVTSESRIRFNNINIFTDSMIALAWLQSEVRLKTFCSSRVAEIRSKTKVEYFYHIPTEHNAADDISRGLDVHALDGRWITGPAFFLRPEEKWPAKQILGQYTKEDFDREVAKKTTASALVTREELPDVGYCSTWKKLVRVRAYVRRFINNFVFAKIDKTKTQEKSLTLQEEENAKMDLIISAQRGLEMKKICSLTPKKTEKGVIVASPRTNQLMGYENYLPPIIPRNAKISELIVAHHHRYGHPGIATCAAKVRREFWIIGVHKIAKKIKFRCVFCREMDGKTQLQIMADLPPVRLQTFSPPFYNTALDYFGPIRVRFSRNKTTKVYGVLFTCLSTRAVYIDIATDYSTAALLMVLRRFFTIRGYPVTFWSDRGTNLVGADLELRKAIQGFDQKSLKDFCHERQIQWRFFTPTAAHQNGCTEALIKSCKRSLRMAIGEQRLSALELQTVCFEVSNLMNSRPIGRLPNDPSDGHYISPNDILLGRASTHIPQGPFDDSYSPRRRLEFCQRIVNTWWKKWYRDVFPNLTPRRKWQTSQRDVKIGDFVLIKEPNPIRGTYTKGVIIETFPGRDGRVRNVRVKTSRGQYERPITRIVVIQPAENDY